MKGKQLNRKEQRYSPRSEDEIEEDKYEAKGKNEPKVLKLNINTSYSRNGRSNSPESLGKLTTSTTHIKSNLRKSPGRAHSPGQLNKPKALDNTKQLQSKSPSPRIKVNGNNQQTEEERASKLLSKKKRQLNEFLWEAAESGNLEQIIKLVKP